MRQGISRYFLATIFTTIMTGSAYAIAPGLYLGMMAGPATNGGSTQTVQILPYPTPSSPAPTTAEANPKSSQFGSRIYLGYKFNQYAGFEGGFVYFSGVNYILPNSTQQAAGGTTVRVRAIDLVAKLDYTLQNTVGIFGKAGVAAVYITTPGGLTPTGYSIVAAPTPTNPAAMKTINSGSNSYTSKVAPVFAVGASYDFNQSWVMDLSWTRYFVGTTVSSMDLYALGLAYHFTDKYCGQFLCDE